MPRWLQFFPRHQIHIVNGDTLIHSPVTELQKVEAFLGLQKFYKSSMFVWNSKKQFFCMKESGKAHCLGKSKGLKHPFISPRIWGKLQQFYKPFNIQFYNMTGTTYDW